MRTKEHADPSITGAPLLFVLVTVVVFVLSGLTVRWLSEPQYR